MGKGLLCILFIFLGFSQIVSGQNFNQPSDNKRHKIHANLIVLKLKSPSASHGRIAFSPEDQLGRLKEMINYEEFYQVFSENSISNGRVTNSNLKHIYKLRFKEGTNIWKELSRMNQLNYIEYAEPFFQNELLLVPNDPEADPVDGLQDYLTVIKAYEGWQIDQSDSTMVIGIVDTGVNMNHEDLGNIAFNYNDPINGVDDDNDGYLDNFYGWDIGDDDNEPAADDHPHGTHVAGISSASTNNAIGMAGIGFNSKYLPVNSWNSTYKTLMNEYEGIVYAADHGCKIVNLSWGRAGRKSKYGQDIINYAVLEKNVVIVAAGGNTHAELDFYPASYDNVLSVGATDMQDNMATWATYSHFIDIMAPGQQVYSTKNNGGYEKSGGSSFASPMVAGAAALVRSHFPTLSAQQVMEQLRVTSDNIYNVGNNMDFYGQMGRGRLNVQHALSDILTPSIRLSEFQFNSNHGDLIFPGDSVVVRMKFTNYLRNAENITITISNPSENVNWEVDQIYIDKLGEFESFENLNDPVKFTVKSNLAPGARLLFRLDFIGNNYSDFQYFEIITTPEYFNISDGNLTATIVSDGDIGYDDLNFENGGGISFNEQHIATNSGFILSIDSTHTLDNVINDFDNFTRDQDYMSETEARLFDNSIADYDARSTFKPYDTATAALEIKVEQKVLAWDNNTGNGYLIFEYRIINTGDSALNGLSAGIFADWNLGEYQLNEAVWDTVENVGYVFDKSSNALYSGLALLSGQSNAYYSIDLDDRNGNTADIDTIFSNGKKHNFLSSSSPKASAGILGAGNDVAQIIGGKGISILPGESVKVAIAMLASASLDGLKSALDLAKSKYVDYLGDPPLAETFFACDGDSALVDPQGDIYEFFADVGAAIRLDSGDLYKTKPVLSEHEYYLVNLDSGYASDINKILVKPGNPSADFLIESDTILIEIGETQTINIENNSTVSNQWAWNFGNGYSSTVENPSVTYEFPGLYDLELIASNTYGCSDTIGRELLVAVRIEQPILADQDICKGEFTTISDENTNLIEVYADAELLNLLYEGTEFTTGTIKTDTSFFVVNAESDFKSSAVETKLFVNHPEMGFDYQVDTTNLFEKYVLNIFNTKGQLNNVSWLANSQFIGDGIHVNYVYANQPFEISQVKVDEDGCYDTLSIRIIPEFSPVPALEDVMICKNSEFIVSPQNGNLFYFYEEMQLTNLLHKGKSFNVTNISEDVEYFITGVDGLLESSSKSIKIKIDPVEANIVASADTIDILNENTVELTDHSIHASNSYWLLSAGTFDTTSIITKQYDLPGTYDYTLVAEGNEGCYDTTTQVIQVLQITGLVEELSSNLKIYPNPVNDILSIEVTGNLKKESEFELIDIMGKRWQTFVINSVSNKHQVDLSQYKRGIYFIRSIDAEHSEIVKILKQ